MNEARVRRSVLPPAWRAFMAAWSLATLTIVGCGSDKFDPTGSSLPIDVRQDSLAVELDPPLPAVQDTSLVPDLSQPFEEREILYLGNRPVGAWRGTPLFRFDFSGVPDTLEVTPETLKSAKLDLEMLDKDQAKGILRQLRLYDLTDTLTASMADADLSTILGEIIDDEIEVISTTTFTVDLPDSVVLDWIEAGTHKGLALFDLTADIDTLDSNFVGFASKEFTRFGSLLDRNNVSETAIPEILLEVNVPGGSVFLAFPVLIDLTHFEREDPGDRLELGSHLPSRCWLTFDVLGSGVPSNATVNQALLRMFLDDVPSLGTLFVDFTGYRSSLEAAATEDRGSLEALLNGSASFDPIEDEELVVDVTELVQRAVNGVLTEGDGVLIALQSELLELTILDFFTQSAVDSLQPRVDVIYTPPADFVE